MALPGSGKLHLALKALLVVIVGAVSVPAQTFSVIHAFSGPDGAFPYAGLTADGKGNFYGTTESGGNTACEYGMGCGTVFQLSHSAGGWTLTTIYVFQGLTDGWEPFARVVFGPDGALYGTTAYGGTSTSPAYGFGTVFKLSPPHGGCQGNSCKWTHSVLYRFHGTRDGANPGPGDLTFDSAGNIYGTTEAGGIVRPSCFLGKQGCGVVFKLSPSGTGWRESVVYSFPGGLGGDLPISGVIFDQLGNLYGTASEDGAAPYGTVFQLVPSGSGWTENTLYSFVGLNDGAYPAGGLIFDAAGNLYGTSTGSPAGGTVFELTPSNSGWKFSLLYLLPFPNDPSSSLTLVNGDLYGTTTDGGNVGFGSVFELMPGSGGWTNKTLHSFGAHNDGSNPSGNVLLDASGNIYGTASGAGASSDGVIFEIKP